MTEEIQKLINGKLMHLLMSNQKRMQSSQGIHYKRAVYSSHI